MLAAIISAGASFFLSKTDATRSIAYALALFTLVSWIATMNTVFILALVGIMVGVFGQRALDELKAEPSARTRAKQQWEGKGNA